jgi:LacI family gluconate utilization system Gnt-I transcriptional repressor|tara:strand:- start:3213 stop:4259 length:1047 start_codon:yes stop_codon:yes gene_type:complete
MDNIVCEVPLINRKLKMGIVTLKDVAVAVGVSEMTVSRAFRVHSDVADKTRARIIAVANEMGYVPNRIASMLASKSSTIIPIIVPSLRNRVFLDIVAAAQEVISAEGYQMMLINTEYSELKETEAVKAVLAWKPAALILSGTNHSEATLKLVQNENFPIIEIMEITDQPIDICVGFSHHNAGRDMGQYLVSKGYQSFAFYGCQIERDARGKQRFEGFRSEIVEAGLPEPKLNNINTKFVDLVEQNLLEEFALDCLKYDCIYCNNDDLAIGILLTLQRLGKKVPEDLAIAGFNNLEMGQLISPGLTTSSSPRSEIGTLSAQFALDRIKGIKLESKVNDLGCRLVPRGSA